VETDATRMCALLVGLPDVNVIGVADVERQPLRVHVETNAFIVDRALAVFGREIVPGEMGEDLVRGGPGDVVRLSGSTPAAQQGQEPPRTQGESGIVPATD
jgi:hypothetical protein